MYTSHFITQNIKKCNQGLKFDKINFYCFIKDILKGNWLVFSPRVLGGECNDYYYSPVSLP